MSPKTWVIITGGVLGHHRDAAGDRPAAAGRPALPGAGGRRLHHHRAGWRSSCWSSSSARTGYIDFEINKWFSIGLIVVIFTIAYLYARKKGPVEDADEDDAAASSRRAESSRRTGNGERATMRERDRSLEPDTVRVRRQLQVQRLDLTLSQLKRVALVFKRSRTSGSFQSPCGM